MKKKTIVFLFASDKFLNNAVKFNKLKLKVKKCNTLSRESCVIFPEDMAIGS